MLKQFECAAAYRSAAVEALVRAPELSRTFNERLHKQRPTAKEWCALEESNL